MSNEEVRKIIEQFENKLESHHTVYAKGVSDFGSDLIGVRLELKGIATKLENIESQMVEYKDAKKTQNGRIGKLENYRSWIAGGLGVISFIVIPLITFIFSSQIGGVKTAQAEIKTKHEKMVTAVNEFMGEKVKEAKNN